MRCSRRTDCRFRPVVEALEDRRTPALTFSVNANGVLTIKGTALDDEVDITTDLGQPAGSFLITEQTSGGPVVTKTVDLTNGAGITGFIIDLGDGNDQLTVNGIQLTGSLTFKGGNGNNVFSMTASFIGGDLKITNGSNSGGIDKATILASTILGSVKIDHGTGLLNLDSSETVIDNGTTIAKNFTLQATTGNDLLTFGEASIAGNVTIKLGDGNNTVQVIGHTVIAGQFAYTGGKDNDKLNLSKGSGSIQVGGSLSIDAGKAGTEESLFIGNDSSVGGFLMYTSNASKTAITLQKSAFAAGATLKLGNGENTVTISTAKLGSVKIQGGSGQDTVILQDVQTTGFLKAHLGTGSNTLRLDAETTTSSLGSRIGGVFDYVGGSGIDTVTIGTNTPDPLLFAGKVTIQTAAGSDFLTIDDSTFLSDLSIFTGTENDEVSLDATVINGVPVSVAGKLTVNTGSGDDQVLSKDQLQVAKATQFLLAAGMDKLTLTGTTTLLGSLSVDTGAKEDKSTDADIVTISGLKVSGNAVFKTGNGNDVLTLDDSAFLGAVLIDTAGGDDQIRLDQSSPMTDVPLTIKGLLTVKAGAGNDTLIFGKPASTDDKVEVMVKPILNGGSGTNTLNYEGLELPMGVMFTKADLATWQNVTP